MRTLLAHSYLLIALGAFILVGLDLCRSWLRRKRPACPCCGWSDTENQ